MRGRRLLVPLLVAALAAALPRAALAAEAAPVTLGLSGPAAAAGDLVALSADLGSLGAGVAGAAVSVERRSGGAWGPVAVVTTDAAGRAQLPVVVAAVAADNTFRASYAGDETHAPAGSGDVVLGLVRRAGVLGLSGPAAVVEGRSSSLQVTWTAANGAPVAGTVVLSRRVGTSWQSVTSVQTGADGRASLDVSPLDDVRYRVEAAALDWVDAATSAVVAIRVLPSGTPVRLPRASPRPRVEVPPQPHALGAGANPVTTAIPDGVWASMTGRSWHPGCPVGRSGLRLVRINYWDYDGFRRRGELVVATGAADQVAGAITAMYGAQLPIRSMYRVDRFGWSRRLDGADDYRSMAAGNTSAFNCRNVVNRPGVRSPHAWGRALDVNTWENPYRSATGLVPNSWWQSRADPRIAWRSRNHAVVRLMAAHGMRWTYGLGDTQHFDARTASGRVRSPRGCADVLCH